MRRLLKLFGLFCSLAFFPLLSNAADKGGNAEPISLKDLPPTDALEIRYLVHGCFQPFEVYVLNFANGMVEITELHLPAIPRAPLAFDRKPLGILPLTKAESDGLEIMLNYFRRPNQMLSTSSLQLQLKQMRDGQIIRQETITHVEDEKPEPAGVIRLHVLIERAKGLKDSPSS